MPSPSSLFEVTFGRSETGSQPLVFPGILYTVLRLFEGVSKAGAIDHCRNSRLMGHHRVTNYAHRRGQVLRKAPCNPNLMPTSGRGATFLPVSEQ